MADSEVFRILSLAGGGARGLLQAEYLALANRDFGGGILKHVDLLAGTSTGAITAGCLAIGVTPERIKQLFHDEVGNIFPPRSRTQKFASFFRDRPRYDVRPLEDALSKLLKDTRLRDVDFPLIITASSVADHQVRIFTSLDGDETLLLDAILASAAAPTYFAPRRLGDC